MKNLFISLIGLLCLTSLSAEADTKLIVEKCSDESGSIEVTIETEPRAGVGGRFAIHSSTLKVDGDEVPRVLSHCVWTPGIRSVVRCPHFVRPGLHAEVYPKFKKDQLGVLEKVVIVQFGAPTIELKKCEAVK